MKKFAVLLSGCGVNDGAEIHEAVATFLAIKQNGADYFCFAPDKPQYHVIDHIKGQPVKDEKRNIMTESARLARGQIKPLTAYKPEDFDGLVLPGGFGAAKNLCTFAFDGADCKIDDGVKDAILKTQTAGKPVGAICIAPVVVAKAFEGSGTSVTLTIGKSPEVAAALEKMGAKHKECEVHQACVDKDNKIVSCPAYMMAQDVAEAASGIEELVKEMIKLA